MSDNELYINAICTYSCIQMRVVAKEELGVLDWRFYLLAVNKIEVIYLLAINK